jgi:hypothetical protein
VPPCRRVYQQDSELRGRVVGGNAEHATDPSPVELSHPTALALASRIRAEVGYDAGDQCLEGRVPVVLGRVYLAVGLHHPAQISRLADRTQHDP